MWCYCWLYSRDIVLAIVFTLMFLPSTARFMSNYIITCQGFLRTLHFISYVPDPYFIMHVACVLYMYLFYHVLTVWGTSLVFTTYTSYIYIGNIFFHHLLCRLGKTPLTTRLWICTHTRILSHWALNDKMTGFHFEIYAYSIDFPQAPSLAVKCNLLCCSILDIRVGQFKDPSSKDGCFLKQQCFFSHSWLLKFYFENSNNIRTWWDKPKVLPGPDFQIGKPDVSRRPASRS